jgi:hypothetical protein
MIPVHGVGVWVPRLPLVSSNLASRRIKRDASCVL